MKIGEITKTATIRIKWYRSRTFAKRCFSDFSNWCWISFADFVGEAIIE